MKRVFSLVLVSLFVLVGAICSAQTPTVWNELFPLGLLDRDGRPVSFDALQGKYVGLYFSAEWCRTCQKFSPLLVPFRNDNAAAFEVVMVSSDKSEAAQFDYMKKYGMLWPTLKYQSAPAKALRERFEVTSIPMLIILSPDGRLVKIDGRTDVEEDAAGALAKWQAITPTPLPFTIEETDAAHLPEKDRLAQLDRKVIDDVNTLRSIPKQGWIKGTIGGKSYYVTFDRTSWTIKGTAGDKPVDIKIDHQNKRIQGYAHDSGVDLYFTWATDAYSLEGDTYGTPYWINISWPGAEANGGIACSMITLSWNLDTGKVTGFLSDRKADMKFDKVSGRLTGDFFKRPIDVQITNLELSDFITHLYLFLK